MNIYEQVKTYKVRSLLISILVLDIAIMWAVNNVTALYSFLQTYAFYDTIMKVASSSFSGLIIAVTYDIALKRESNQSIITTVQNFINDTFKKTVKETLLYDKDIQKDLLSIEIINEIFYNCLAIKLNDELMAKEIINSLIDDVISKYPKVSDLVVKVFLEKIKYSDYNLVPKYDVLLRTEHITYKSKLNTTTFTFMITDNKLIQEKYLFSYPYPYVLHSKSAKISEKYFFEVDDVTIDGILLKKIEQKEEEDCYYYKFSITKDIEKLLDKDVLISYKVKSLIRKKSNYYSYFVPFITKNLSVTFDVFSSDITRIRALPYFNSGKSCTITEYNDTNNPNNPRRVSLDLNDWVFPKSGITLVWQFGNN